MTSEARLHQPPLHCRSAIALALIGCLALAGRAWGQQTPIQYAYDALGRLVAVTDQGGNTAIYMYDAVGNIAQVLRVDAGQIPGPVGIAAVVPGKGRVGSVVSILGKGFGATPAQNTVLFNGTPASVASAAFNRLTVTVPSGATSGFITVTTDLGTATSPAPFRIPAPITVSPPLVALPVNGTQQFEAHEGGAPTSTVLWTVNGVVGGDGTFGTITEGGLYTVPATAPTPPDVTIGAINRDDTALFAEAHVSITRPTPLFIASRTVSVAAGHTTVDRNVGASASVAVTPTAAIENNVQASASVTAAVGVTAAVTPAVSALIDSSTAATSAAADVSAARIPVITEVSPAAAPRGVTDLTITITGAGLDGATSLAFMLGASTDPNIVAGSLAVSPDGSRLTAQLSIAALASLGARVVRITMPAGTSTLVGTGGNVFTVQ